MLIISVILGRGGRRITMRTSKSVAFSAIIYIYKIYTHVVWCMLVDKYSFDMYTKYMISTGTTGYVCILS